MEKIMIRITAYGFDKQLSMMTTYHDAVDVDVSQFDKGMLHEACYHMRATLENKGDITVRQVSARAVIEINGVALTSRVVEKF